MKRITVAQLQRAIKTAPREVKIEGQKFIQRGLSEYKRQALQTSPWRVGQSGGGVPVDTGNLFEQHRTRITGLRGTFGVRDQDVPYAKYVHGDSPRPVKVKGRDMRTRPWLDYAKDQAQPRIKVHEKRFIDSILKHIAT